MYVRMYVCTYVHMYVCTYVHMYVRMYICTYVRMYVCMYDVCMYICMLHVFSLLFSFVPYIGMVTIIMNDYPKFKVYNFLRGNIVSN